MIWIRLIVMALGFLLGIYYWMLIAHIWGPISFTNRNITFGRCLIPFYYWIASTDEPKKKRKSKRRK
jgi:hypothetical protein